jgi:multiple sugar transport system ATP-binding protein
VGKVYPEGSRAVEDLNLEIADGEFMVLVGPSGCGKTTALRMVAGLEDISEGEICIGGRTVNLLEPRKRDVAMVFQNYALYPHMSVFDNIAFPLRTQRMRKSEITERVQQTAGILGLRELLQRRPRTLSGGQRQRVAMGRAIIRQPKVFLMDEPLSNLDAKLRVQMRAEIAELQRELGTTTIYVTHDQVEALTMGTRIAVMRKGVLQQVGPPQLVYDKPTNLFVATFIGAPPMNLFRARLEQSSGGMSCVIRNQRLRVPEAVSSVLPGLAAYVGRDVAVGLRPEHLTEAAHDGGEVGELEGEISIVEALGSEHLVHLRLDADPVLTEEVMEVARDTDEAAAETLRAEAREHRVTIIARLSARSTVQPHQTARLVVELAQLHFFALDTGEAIR